MLLATMDHLKARDDTGLFDADLEQVLTPYGLIDADLVQVVVSNDVEPPPVAWIKPVIGAATTNDSSTTWADLEALVGDLLIRRSYLGGNHPASYTSTDMVLDVAQDIWSCWSFKPDYSGGQITFNHSSTLQNAFSAFLDTIPSGHKTTIVAWHEPEQEINAGYFTLAEWGLLQNTLADIIHAKGRPELTLGICIMGPWTFNVSSAFHTWAWDTCLDWSKVDYVGIDPYQGSGSTTSLETQLTTPSGSMPSMMQKILTWGRPWMVMEYNTNNSTVTNQATYFTEAYAWFKTWNQAHPATPCAAAMVFNVTLSGDNTRFLTGESAAAVAATNADSKV